MKEGIKNKEKKKMESYIWFYVIGMLVLIGLNIIQLIRSSGKKVINWIQIAIYAGSIIWFVFCLVGLYASWFFFGTSIAYILAFAFECGQLSIKFSNKAEKKLGFDFLIVFMAFLPVIFSQAILANVLPF